MEPMQLISAEDARRANERLDDLEAQIRLLTRERDTFKEAYETARAAMEMLLRMAESLETEE